MTQLLKTLEIHLTYSLERLDSKFCFKGAQALVKMMKTVTHYSIGAHRRVTKCFPMFSNRLPKIYMNKLSYFIPSGWLSALLLPFTSSLPIKVFNMCSSIDFLFCSDIFMIVCTLSDNTFLRWAPFLLVRQCGQ